MIGTKAQIYMHQAVSIGPRAIYQTKQKKIIDGIASVKHEIPMCKFFIHVLYLVNNYHCIL